MHTTLPDDALDDLCTEVSILLCQQRNLREATDRVNKSVERVKQQRRRSLNHPSRSLLAEIRMAYAEMYWTCSGMLNDRQRGEYHATLMRLDEELNVIDDLAVLNQPEEETNGE